MRAVIQRVNKAAVHFAGKTTGAINQGFLVLLGIGQEDDQNDIEWLVKKLCALRLFDDEDGLMNRSIQDIDGEFLVVSQFTLHAKYKKGNRPSFIRAAKPDTAIPLYEAFCNRLGEVAGKTIATGEFGANMDVELTNDGPVTLIIDTKNKE